MQVRKEEGGEGVELTGEMFVSVLCTRRTVTRSLTLQQPAAPVFPCERGALSGNITVVCSLVSLVRLCGRPQSSLDCETKTEQECLALPDVHCEVNRPSYNISSYFFSQEVAEEI